MTTAPSPSDAWLGAQDAARMLRVTLPTLYAYVSRGLVRSEATSSASRARRYSREDVERLRRRAEERRQPDKVAAHAMHWGLPVLESSITLIAGGALYYRGHDAVALSRARSVADVASLVWMGAFDMRFASRTSEHTRARTAGDAMTFIARAQTSLASASTRDASAFDLRPDRVADAGWRIMQLVAHAAAPSNAGKTIDERLAEAWGVRSAGADVLRAAIILCADHELNVSAFTARCVASAGASPYAVVVAGLAALEGSRHGGSTVRVEAMLAGLRRERRVRTALAERLRRGERIEGVGHPLYPDGDPRATELLSLLAERYKKSPELEFVQRAADAATDLTGERPNVDFALGAVSRVLRLPQSSGIALFAIGRTIGWIGQAVEQYQTGQIIRPRAKYVGVAPHGDSLSVFVKP